MRSLVVFSSCDITSWIFGVGKMYKGTNLFHSWWIIHVVLHQTHCFKLSDAAAPHAAAHWNEQQALDSSSGVVRMWVRVPAWLVAALVSLSKTLNYNCFVLRMGRKAVGPVCCVMHVKEPRTLIVKEKAPWAPSRVDMCALQIFCIIIINNTYWKQIRFFLDLLWQARIPMH